MIRSLLLWSACLVAMAALSAGVRAQNEMLFPAEELAWGDSGAIIATGDIDLDGILDIVTSGRICDYAVSSCSLGLFVRYGRPDRTFSEPQFHLAGSQVVQFPAAIGNLVIRDLTGDSWPDLAFLDYYSREIVVLPSLGAGSLGNPVVSICTETLDPVGGLDFAELDGDGIVDAVVAVSTTGASCKCVQVLRGTGTGSFDQTVTYFMGGNLRHPKVRDLDGDGILDLFAVKGAGGLVVRLGLAGGGYAEPVVTLPPTPMNTLELVDLDADGLLDIVGTSYSPQVSVLVLELRNVGGGAFSVVDSIPLLDVSPYFTYASLTVADMNGDSLPDLLTSIPSIYSFEFEELADNALLVLEGQGNFAFAEPVQVEVIAAPYQQLLPADLDADGSMDLVYGGSGYPACVGIRYGIDEGGFEIGSTVGLDSAAVDIASGDIDSDGHIDLVLAHSDDGSGLSIQLGLGDGSFTTAPPITAPESVERVLLTDVSDDGALDLVTASSAPGPAIHVLLGIGDGSFEAPVMVSGERVVDLEIVDIDQDGFVDLLSCDPQSKRVHVQRGLGGGQFSSPESFPSGGPSRRLSVGDLDEDGHLDIVVANPDPETAGFTQLSLVTLFGEGGGRFSTPMGYELVGAQDITVVDLDRDSHQDVVAAQYAQFLWGEWTVQFAGVQLLRGLGDGALVEPHGLLAGTYSRVETADLNQDGWLDVISAAAPLEMLGEFVFEPDEENCIGIALGRPDLPAFEGFAVHALAFPIAATIADFNEDGFPDIAAVRSESGSISILMNQSTTWGTLGHDSAPPSGGSAPLLTGSGTPAADLEIVLEASSPLLQVGDPGLLVVGFEAAYSPFQGGILVPAAQGQTPMQAGPPLISRWPKGIPPGTPVYAQALFTLPGGDVVASNALVVIAQ